MNTASPLLFAFLACLFPLAGQDQEPVVSKETLSVHTVERGDMPLFERASGLLTSVQPPRAVVTLSGDHAKRCQVGGTARVQIDSPRALAGKVVKRLEEGTEAGGCEIELSDPVPNGTSVGVKVGALVQAGELKNVVFFGRPADSSANSEAMVFVVEPGSSFAHRVSVRYGAISGPLIQVIKGLAPGDHVIVTDMSKWVKYPRVRMQ